MAEASCDDNYQDKSASIIQPKKPQSFMADLKPILKEHGAKLIKTETLEVASFDSQENMSLATKSMIEEIARKTIAEKGKFTVALCGGKAPKVLFALLKESDINWSKIHLFWGDERPPRFDIGQTNYETACEGFLQYIKIPSENVHKINLVLEDHKKAAKDYAEEIKSTLGQELQFDLMLLGGGGKGQMEGHTMGLKKNSEVFSKLNPDLVEVIIREDTGFGYTMTPQLLEKARQIIVLLPGEEKKEIVNELMKATRAGKDYPIGILNTVGKGKTIVMTDQSLSKDQPTS